MKGVQCNELFGGIALKNHVFSFSFFFSPTPGTAPVKFVMVMVMEVELHGRCLCC